MNCKVLILLAGVALCGCSSSSRPQVDSAVEASPISVIESPIITVTEQAPAIVPPKIVSHGFAVIDFRARRDEYDRVSVIGEIKNVGPDMRGVELQAVLRDSVGRLIAVAHFYPASNGCIRANETWPFAYSLGLQQEAVKAELRIVGDFRTVEILSATTY